LTRQSLPSVNFNDIAARDDAAGDDNTVLYLQFFDADVPEIPGVQGVCKIRRMRQICWWSVTASTCTSMLTIASSVLQSAVRQQRSTSREFSRT